MKLNTQDILLVTGGSISAVSAIWHLLMILGGPSWYAFARAPEYVVESAKEGTFVAPVGAIAIALLMFICTAYSLSGAGLIRKIPLLKSALVIISLLCLARGLYISPIFFRLQIMGTWHIVASSVWFFVGLCYLAGAIKQLFLNGKTHITSYS